MTDIEKLKQDVREAEEALMAAKKRLHDARCERAGIKAGDRVKMIAHKHVGKRARVTKVEPWEFGTYLYGCLDKKDGTFGAREIWLGQLGYTCERIDE